MNHLRLSITLRSQSKILSRAFLRHGAATKRRPGEYLSRSKKQSFYEDNEIISIQISEGEKFVVNKKENYLIEQGKLIDKHKRNFTKKPTTIFELIESVDFFQNIPEYKIILGIEFLVDPKFDTNVLSDRQIALFFNMSGEKLIDCDSSTKNMYTDQLFNIFEHKNTKFGILGANAYFKTKFENKDPISVSDFYEFLSKHDIEPNVETFEILADYHAKNGDNKSILNLINTMNEVKLTVTTAMFASLVESLVISNQTEKARSLIASLESKRQYINMQTLKHAFTNGLAFSNHFDLLLKSVQEFGNEYNLSKFENNTLILETIATFANVSKNVRQVEEIANMIPNISNNCIDKFYTKCIDIVADRNISAVTPLYSYLTDKHQMFLRSHIVRVFTHHILQDCSLESIEETVDMLDKYLIINNPLNSGLSYLNKHNSKKFYEVFELFKKSKEYEQLQDRILVIKANFGKLMDEFNDTEDEDKKINILKEVLGIFNKLATSNFSEKNEMFESNSIKKSIHRLFENDNLILLEKICQNSTRSEVKFFLRDIIRKYLYFKNFKSLQQVIDIMRKSKIDNINLANSILNSIEINLKNKESTPEIISTCSSLLSIFFDPKKEKLNDKKTVVGVLKEVIVNKFISDDSVSLMIDQLADQGKVSISKKDYDEISDTLNSIGFVSRKHNLSRLIHKSNTLIRWLETKNVLLLERELVHLQKFDKENSKSSRTTFLRTIILPKHMENTPINYQAVIEHLKVIYASKDNQLISKVNYIPSKLMDDLMKTKNNNFADELYNIDGINLSESAYLLYAFNHLLNDKKDKMEEVFKRMEKNGILVDDTTIILVAEHLPIADSEKIEQFITSLRNTFKISEVAAKHAHISGYKCTFQRLLHENKLEEAFEVAEKIGSITSSAFGQIDLMSASIKNSNVALFGKILNWVKALHSNYISHIDSALALLENGKFDVVKKTLDNMPELMISQKKLKYIIFRETNLGNVDVLKFILSFISQKDWCTDEMLNSTLSAILDIYVKQNMLSEIQEFKETLVKENFPFTVAADLMFKKYS